jgi:hypothetical protein
MDAVRALKTSALFREKMGSDFIDYIVAPKEFEISRFLSHVTDWEHREYSRCSRAGRSNRRAQNRRHLRGDHHAFHDPIPAKGWLD